ncbi:metal-sulfur cluster assembly factor [Thiohalomonas denitrificans]|uniref:Metal-sulfur cluster biosynthetic enzyme n=1 Tax=Thiohalomonas denitrificans TaxID=415747 RepID=A0A1G5QK70_9GAMM|nr:metal-sulfur cluster assembly factor [Thiohalomonas denitrificans]SCZ62157.1 Metal-sulfur cluster biosynthetic enzyme [Thiohalomonas denitrificans]
MAGVDREKLESALREVIDPEVGVNIYDLGLIYDVLASEEGDLQVRMTMTTPACPVSAMLADQVREALLKLPQVRDVEVELVWDPPWSPERMSESARRQLGW